MNRTLPPVQNATGADVGRGLATNERAIPTPALAPTNAADCGRVPDTVDSRARGASMRSRGVRVLSQENVAELKSAAKAQAKWPLQGAGSCAAFFPPLFDTPTPKYKCPDAPSVPAPPLARPSPQAMSLGFPDTPGAALSPHHHVSPEPGDMTRVGKDRLPVRIGGANPFVQRSEQLQPTPYEQHFRELEAWTKYREAIEPWLKCKEYADWEKSQLSKLKIKIAQARDALCKWLSKYYFVFDAATAPELIVTSCDLPAIPEGALVRDYPRLLEFKSKADMEAAATGSKASGTQSWWCPTSPTTSTKWSVLSIVGGEKGEVEKWWNPASKTTSTPEPRAYLSFVLNKQARDDYVKDVLPFLLDDAVFAELSEPWKLMLRGRAWYTPNQLTDAIGAPVGPPTSPSWVTGPGCNTSAFPADPACLLDESDPAHLAIADGWGTYWGPTATAALAAQPVRKHTFVQFIPYLLTKLSTGATPTKEKILAAYTGAGGKSMDGSYTALAKQGQACSAKKQCAESSDCAPCAVPVWLPFLRTSIEQLLKVAAKAAPTADEACLFVMGWGYQPGPPPKSMNKSAASVLPMPQPPLEERDAVDQILSYPMFINPPKQVTTVPGWGGLKVPSTTSNHAFLQDWLAPPAPSGRVTLSAAAPSLWTVAPTKPPGWAEVAAFLAGAGPSGGGWVWPDQVWSSKLGLPTRTSTDKTWENPKALKTPAPPPKYWRFWETTLGSTMPMPTPTATHPGDAKSAFLNIPYACGLPHHFKTFPYNAFTRLPYQLFHPCHLTHALCDQSGDLKMGSDVRNFPNGLMMVD